MNRYDGRRLKTLDPFVEMIPYIMPKRYDAHVFSKVAVETDSINAYIKEKRLEGQRLTYLHIFIAVLVRIIAQRPKLNRFVMNNKYYARNKIWISMAIKRTLKDEGQETTVKFHFTGRENIFEIAQIIDKTIEEGKHASEGNDTERLAKYIMSLPNFLVKFLMSILRQMDKWGILPKDLIETSPFHTTIFFTYLKSIKLDYVYHHIYDFGSTGIFISLGKQKKAPIAKGNEVQIGHICEMGLAMDERICDGLYFSNSMKLMNKYLNNLYLLEEGLEEVVEDIL
ncbi:MAG: 2-oxoglutarate dehydrogenase [Clostridiales bacterium]|nr:2-oxoglutarate dehydrogenase [Clostridiales bacterium]